MATQQLDTAPDNSSDAAFRLWGEPISLALAAVGLVKVTGLGEIDWDTVVRGEMAGFEIWRTDDSPLTTWYFRIEYGGDSGGIAEPFVNIQCATGVDGSGNLTGSQISASFNLQSPNTGATSRTSYISGDSGRLVMALFTGNSGSMGFSFERSRDANGDETDDEVALQAWSDGAQNRQYRSAQTIHKTDGPIFPKNGPTSSPLVWSGIYPPLDGGATTGVSGLNQGLYPLHPWRGPVGAPSTNLVMYFDADIPELSQITHSELYGQSHTYLALGGTNLLIASSPVFTAMMRYD